MARAATAAVRLLTGEREPVRLATTANITTVEVDGLDVIQGLQTVDGVLTEVGDRVLVKDQTNQTINGIYVASVGTWRRASDARSARSMQKGTTAAVQIGSTNAGNVYSFQTDQPNIGSDDIVISLFLSGTPLAFGDVIDEDDMASDSATKIPTQQSVKAYADAKIGRVASRAAMAALALSAVAVLTESGREGTFTFVASDLSGFVTADTAQALYVAPASDTTGASGAWVRQRDDLHVIDTWAGAKVDNATNDSAAANAAISILKAMGGGQLSLAPGIRRWNSTVTIDNSADAGRTAKRVFVRGMGSPFTEVRSVGLAGPTLSYVGNSTYPESHFSVSGVKFTGDLTTGGVGIDVNISAFMLWTDVIIEGYDKNFRVNDTEQSVFVRCAWRWGNDGIVVTGSVATTDANGWNFIECSISNNYHRGITAAQVNSWKFTDGSIQYNGALGTVGHWGAKFTNPGTGYGVIQFDGTTQIEGNGGEADLWVDGTTDPFQLVVGAQFARSGSGVYATNCIKISGAAAVKILKIKAETNFKHYNTYVVSAARPYLNLAADTIIDCDPAAYFMSATEAPSWAYIGGQRTSRQDGVRLFRTGSDVNFQVANSFSLAGGVMWQALSDALALIPAEIRGQRLRLTTAGVDGVEATGRLVSLGNGGGIGYGTGAGNSVVQATNKATGVAINTMCGRITTHNASLAAAAEVSFTVTNAAIAATDVVVASIASGATAGAYGVTVDAVAAGSFRVSLTNQSAGALGEALVINFAIIKAVTS